MHEAGRDRKRVELRNYDEDAEILRRLLTLSVIPLAVITGRAVKHLILTIVPGHYHLRFLDRV